MDLASPFQVSEINLCLNDIIQSFNALTTNPLDFKYIPYPTMLWNETLVSLIMSFSWIGADKASKYTKKLCTKEPNVLISGPVSVFCIQTTVI